MDVVGNRVGFRVKELAKFRGARVVIDRDTGTATPEPGPVLSRVTSQIERYRAKEFRYRAAQIGTVTRVRLTGN